MGLIGGIARTAVVAGTATAVSNRVSRRQANRWAQQGQAQPAYLSPQPPPQQYAQPGYAQPAYPQPAPQYAPPPPPPPPPAVAATSSTDMAAQLKQLANLKEQGILTEEEFAEAKAKILAS